MATIVELVNEANSIHDRATDKNNSGFGAVYDELFAPYKDTAEMVMELGVNRGGSLYVWDKYFTKAQIHGVDRRQKYKEWPTTRTHYHLANLGLPEDLNDIASICNHWDIIIDDASHSWSHQIMAFEALFPKVRRGGIFVVEDVETSYSPSRIEDPPCISFMEYTKNLIDGVVWVKDNPNPWGIESILVRDNMVVFKKA